MYDNDGEGLLKIAGPTHKVSDSVGRSWGPIVCISNKSLGNAEATDPRATF